MWYSLEPPRRVPAVYVLDRNKKVMSTPVKPSFTIQNEVRESKNNKGAFSLWNVTCGKGSKLVLTFQSKDVTQFLKSQNYCIIIRDCFVDNDSV